MEEKEIRIFPNSQKWEFKTEGGLSDYIENELRTAERNGRYNFRRFKLVKNIPAGSTALFRFASKIIGWGEILEKAIYKPFSNPDYGDYEGYLLFKPETIKTFDPPLLIKDLEKITGLIFHFKDNYNTGRVYYRIPLQFKVSIQSVVKEM